MSSSIDTTRCAHDSTAIREMHGSYAEKSDRRRWGPAYHAAATEARQ